MKKRKKFVWRSFKTLSLSGLRRNVGKWVAWDNIGLIRKNNELKMYAPGLIKKVSNRRQITIYVPSMFFGGVNRKVKLEELFFDP